MKTVMTAVMLAALALVVAAADVTGTWTMNVVGGTPDKKRASPKPRDAAGRDGT